MRTFLSLWGTLRVLGKQSRRKHVRFQLALASLNNLQPIVQSVPSAPLVLHVQGALTALDENMNPNVSPVPTAAHVLLAVHVPTV